MRRIIVMTIACLMCCTTSAQEDSETGCWLSASTKKKIDKKWSLGIEVELRTSDVVKNIDRWSAGIGAEYSLSKWLKADAGYTFINNYHASKLTPNGKNMIDDYWLTRHRLYTSLRGKWSIGRWSIGLRERYQWTHNGEKTVAKRKVSTGKYKEDKTIEAQTKHILRSRLEVAYEIEDSRFTPFASIELHNILNGLSLDKTRLSIGTDIVLTKRQKLEVAYKYQNYRDSSESNQHILSVGYSFKL